MSEFIWGFMFGWGLTLIVSVTVIFCHKIEVYRSKAENDE